MIKTSDLIKLFLKKGIEQLIWPQKDKNLENNSGKYGICANPFQNFTQKKVKEIYEEDKFVLSNTGLLNQLPKINEEIEREYNTENKKKSESKIKKIPLKKKINSIDSNSSWNSWSQDRYNEKWWNPRNFSVESR